MNIFTFSAIPNSGKVVNATVASGNVAMLAQPSPNYAQNIRVVNASDELAFINFGDSTVAASADDLPVLPNSERIFSFPGTATHAAAILAANTGDVYFQLGQGV